MFPACIRNNNKSSANSNEDISKQTHSVVQIYTDWANHYLEKGRSKRRVSHLASDCSDGILLADVIESVTNSKIPDINKKPKNSSQMLENINSCVRALKAQHVAGIDDICAADLQEGRLKAVLALFFALSRHKQATKHQRTVIATAQQFQQQQQQLHYQQQVAANAGSAGAAVSNVAMAPHNIEPHVTSPRTLSGGKVSNGTSIPLPGSALPTRRCPPDKIRPINNTMVVPPATTTGSVSSSRASSPAPSMIPRVGSQIPAQKQIDKTKISIKSQQPMLPTFSGKRTSSSSGVSSSAKSEKSDSSFSLDDKSKCTKGNTAPKVKNISPPTQKLIKKDFQSSTKNISKVASKLTEPKIKITKPVASTKQDTSKTPGTGIPKPTAAVKGTAKIVEKVAPLKEEGGNTELSESSHSASTGQHSNSSESSVIYRPSSESGSEVPLKPVHGRDNSLGEEESVSLTMSVKPMPLVRGYCNNLTMPNVRPNPRYLLQRKLHTTLPNTVEQALGHGPGDMGDYCNIEEIVNGYMSDGELIRQNDPRTALTRVSNGIYDGYTSEQDYRGIGQLNHGVGRNPMGNPGAQRSLTVLTEQTRPQRGARPNEEVPPPLGPRPPNHISPRTSQRTNPENTENPQWKKYTDSPGVGTPIPPAGSQSPTSSRREKKPTKTSSKVRVPQSFGYVKRNSVDSTPVQVGQKTAQVSVVPRTKVKVSGGTQTCTSDLQQKPSPPSQYKSYSLTGNAANQLSQSVRERLMMGSQSLPKGVLNGSGIISNDYGLVLRQSRPKASDGSLSDTQATENSSPYAPWLRHSNTYSMGARLGENDSLESLASFHGHRSSLTHTRLLRDSTPSSVSPTARLSRSNSIRSTKSEKLYPSMLHRGAEIETEPYYCLPVGALHWSQPTSPAPGGTAPGAPHLFPLSPTHGMMTARHAPKNDEVHGSSVSLVSTTSSLYSSAEEKQAHEIRKLRRELIDAQEKVHTLTSQLTTNAHVVSAFEQSLLSMTQRLQHLTATSERKDSELAELRSAMEHLRTQSAGLSGQTVLVRQPSSDSVSSMSSACSLDKQDKKKKKGWLRSSFTKAFSRNAKQAKVQTLSSNCENVSNSSVGDKDSVGETQVAEKNEDGFTDVEVEELQKQLREKDLVLTDIRLEALSSAHQLESLKDTVMKMRSEMLSLKQNNERLQRMVGGSLDEHDSQIRSNDPPPDVIAIDDNSMDQEHDGKRISISVYLGQPSTFDKYYIDNYKAEKSPNFNENHEICICYKLIGPSLSWGQLDIMVRRTFKQHVAKLDPVNSLGLGGDSVASYRLGDAERSPSIACPDLLPFGYIVGRVQTLHIVLQPVCALAFEALIPRSVGQRLASLLAEHKRIVLCGPPGTGKTHLAQRLAEFHAQTLGRDPQEAVATFNVDHKSGKELRQYLTHLGEQTSDVLPCVIVLDNLHRAGPLNEALGSLPRTLPCLIGTMAQAACSTTNLQLQHGFRWVLIAPHLEPASGLLGRVLRRRLTTLELTQGERPELAQILNWLPRVWKHLNKFLETHSSGDVTIGPRLFLACPLDMDASKAWFADVWNYSLAPYLREAAKEGLQLYGKRAPWVDPVQFILDTYPWGGSQPQTLTRIGPQDVGLENLSQSDDSSDPLLNMLMRLQEAANYSSPHSNDSDCASLDSNVTHESSVVAINLEEFNIC